MELIANILLAGGAFGAATYCFVLQRRLSRFTELESGMGNAIAVLSAQVDDLRAALEKAHRAATGSTDRLDSQISTAQAAAERLELLITALHDLPDAPAPEFEQADDSERRPRFVRHRPRREVEAAE